MTKPHDPNQVDSNANPLMVNFRIPGETFSLPSGGLFYSNGELDDDVVNGEIMVLPMTTVDEILLKTPDKLLSGEAIKDVFKRCMPQIKKPLDLLAKDVDFLLACLRKISYGEFIEIEYTHDCEGAMKEVHQISLTPFIQQSKKLDPTHEYGVTLGSGHKIKLMPPRFANVLKLYQSAQDSTADIETLSIDITNTLTNMIIDVDGVDNRKHIAEWLSNLRVGWVKEISTAIEEMGDWGPDFSTEVTCNQCGATVPISTPVNPIAFFM